jgi:hypothetical protein
MRNNTLQPQPGFLTHMYDTILKKATRRKKERKSRNVFKNNDFFLSKIHRLLTNFLAGAKLQRVQTISSAGSALNINNIACSNKKLRI